jgi:hypothetical protein
VNDPDASGVDVGEGFGPPGRRRQRGCAFFVLQYEKRMLKVGGIVDKRIQTKWNMFLSS